MASGYEKAECGVKEGGGWGTPRRLESACIVLVALGLSVLNWWWLLAPLFRWLF